jgi:hypothetical protein
VTNDDRVVADHNFLYQQTDDPLTFEDIECFGRGAQATEERRQCLRQAQIGSTVLLLRSDRLQFGMHCPFSLAQLRQPASQLVQRQQILLVRCHQTLDALAHPRQIAL